MLAGLRSTAEQERHAAPIQRDPTEPKPPTDPGDVRIVARAVEASGATQTLEGAHSAMHAVRVLVR